MDVLSILPSSSDEDDDDELPYRVRIIEKAHHSTSDSDSDSDQDSDQLYTCNISASNKPADPKTNFLKFDKYDDYLENLLDNHSLHCQASCPAFKALLNHVKERKIIKAAMRREHLNLSSEADLSQSILSSAQPSFLKIFTCFESCDELVVNFENLESFISPSVCDISKFDQYLLVILKLKMNISFENLAMQFKVTPKTCENIFLHWIDVMYIKLNCYVSWPCRDDFLKILPADNTDQICIYSERLTIVLLKQGETVPSVDTKLIKFNKMNSVHFIVALAPDKRIFFVSNPFKDVSSELKTLSTDCKMFDQAEVDIIIGYDHNPRYRAYSYSNQTPAINQSIASNNLRLSIPDFLNKMKEKFSILSRMEPLKLPVNDDQMESLTRKIVVVCCALYNLNAMNSK